MHISHPTSQSIAAQPDVAPRVPGWFARIHRKLTYKRVQRKYFRYALLSLNLLFFLGIVGFVMQSTRAVAQRQPTAAAVTTLNNGTANPVDQLSSSDIAVNVAQMANMPETTAVTNQADTATAEAAITSVNSAVVSKPQIVATALKSRHDIRAYIVQPGDDVNSVASKFGLSPSSIQWSNGIAGTALAAGAHLTIPPVNGVAYTVKSGDTVASLAQQFHADQAKIIAYNDAEISGIYPGELVLIPDGQVIAAAASITSGIVYGGSAAYGAGGSCYYGGHLYPGYGYDCGYCTWWVAMRRAQAGDALPSNLGNASSWAYLARSYGLSVGSTPQVGAAVVTSTAGAGHVGYVTSVNGDGTITISEMNHEGWNVVDTRTLPVQGGFTYIY